MSFETVCFSMYSLMSRRTMESSLPKYAAARALHNSVFPTPVGPQKMKEAMGRFGFCRPARARRTALEMATTASSCPMTRLCNTSSSATRRADSSAETFSTGTPVHVETTFATSSSETTGLAKACSNSSGLNFGASSSASMAASASWVINWCILTSSASSCTFSSAAKAKSCNLTACSFLSSTSRNSARTSVADSGICANCCSCTRAPVSSKRSMALSGRKRSWMYCEANLTQASMAWSE
mmetsp:Transcript_139460/g.353680  ORF Transcript_139460/g.353680 Transcript_139460/m.353680 type:complete len:240 (+) Transcript_139460:946-1665(+)